MVYTGEPMACFLLPTPPSPRALSQTTSIYDLDLHFVFKCTLVKFHDYTKPTSVAVPQHKVSLGAHFGTISHINTHKQSHEMKTIPAWISQVNFVIFYWHACFTFRVQSRQIINLPVIACLIYIYFSKQFKVIAKLIKNKGPRNTKHDLMMSRKVSITKMIQ